MLRRAAASLLSALLLFVAVTWLALDASEVVTVETTASSVTGHTATNTVRRTRVWFVATQGALYLEAGHPENPWVQDLPRQTTIRLSGAGLDGEYHFEMSSGASQHEKIRSLMRAKYGWRDWWVGLLFDTSQSSLVRLRKSNP